MPATQVMGPSASLRRRSAQSHEANAIDGRFGEAGLACLAEHAQQAVLRHRLQVARDAVVDIWILERGACGLDVGGNADISCQEDGGRKRSHAGYVRVARRERCWTPILMTATTTASASVPRCGTIDRCLPRRVRVPLFSPTAGRQRPHGDRCRRPRLIHRLLHKDGGQIPAIVTVRTLKERIAGFLRPTSRGQRSDRAGRQCGRPRRRFHQCLKT
jgi:hypothetical protein